MKDIIKTYQYRVANLAIGASAFRNAGGKGLIKIGILFFDKIDLNNFSHSLKIGEYKNYLNKQTKLLENELKVKLKTEKAKNLKCWGLARKGLNLFFRDVFQNRFLSSHYDLKIDYMEQLELPMDSFTGKGLFRDVFRTVKIPPWKTVKGLTPKENECYQEAAKEISKKRNLKPVELDQLYWRNPELK